MDDTHWGVVVSMETLKRRCCIAQKGTWVITALIVEFIALYPAVEKRMTEVTTVELSPREEERPTEVTKVELMREEERPTTQQFTLLYCSRLDNPNLWQLLESLFGSFSPMGDALLISGGIGAAESENFLNILSPTESSSQTGDGSSSLLDDGRKGDCYLERTLPPCFASTFKDHNRKRKDRHHEDQSSGDAFARAGGVPWMLMRLLLGVFIRGGDVKRDHSGGRASHISLLALQMCISLLNSLRANAYRFYRFEVVHAAAVVASSLRESKCDPTSPWSAGGLQLLVKCLQDESDAIKSLLLSATEQKPSLSRIRFGSQSLRGGFWQFLDDILLSWKLLPNSKQSRMKNSSSSRDTSCGSSSSHGSSSQCDHTESVYDFIAEAETSNLELNSLTIADLTCDTLCRALRVELKFGDDSNDSVKGDSKVAFMVSSKYESFWEVWDAAMVPVLQEAAGHEQAALKLRVDVSNRHEHAARLLDDLRVKCTAFEASHRECMSYFSETAMVFRKKEKERATSLLETKDKDEKLRKGIWESVLARLAVERGIWGTGASRTNFAAAQNRIDRHGEVTITTSWVLDEWEDDLNRHLRLRLQRTPCRFNHVGAAARGGGLVVDNKMEKCSSSAPHQHQERQDNIHEGKAVVNAAEAPRVNLSVSVVEGSNEGWSPRSSILETNLWKDLCKCRAIGHRGYDASAVADELFEVEEESSLPQLSSSDILRTINADDDTVIASIPCNIIRPYCVSCGCFYISKQQCAFVQDNTQQPPHGFPTQDKTTTSSIGGLNNNRITSPLCPLPTTVWVLNDILSLEMLPYRYQHVGLELFFFNSPPVLLVMKTEEDCR